MSLKNIRSFLSSESRWTGFAILLVLIELISWKLVDIAFVLTIGTIVYFEGKNNSWRGVKEIFSRLKWVNVFILIWLISNILGYFLSVKIGQEQIDEILGLRWILTFYACVYLGANLKISDKGLKAFSIAFLALLTLGVCWQYLSGIRIDRLEGSLRNANIFAYTIAIPWISWVTWESCSYRQTKKIDWIYAGIISAVAVMIFFTFGRGTWIAMAVMFFVISCLTANRRNFLFMAVGGVLSWVLFLGNVFGLKDRLLYSFDFSAGSSQSVRLALWKVNWAIFKDHPIFGIGFYENIRMEAIYYAKMGIINREVGANLQYLNHAHNQALQILVGSGLVGFVAFFALMFLGGVFFLKRFFNSNSELERRVGLIGFSVLMMFIATGLFECPLNVHESRSYFLMFSGFCTGFLLIGRHARSLHCASFGKLF